MLSQQGDNNILCLLDVKCPLRYIYQKQDSSLTHCPSPQPLLHIQLVGQNLFTRAFTKW